MSHMDRKTQQFIYAQHRKLTIMRTIKLGLTVMFLLILISNVYGVGIAPAKRVIEFVPFLEKEFTGLIVNTAEQDVVVTLLTEDPFGILILRNTTINMTPSDKEVRFSYKIQLPQNLSANGTLAKIVAQEKTGTGTITSILSAESVIEVVQSQDNTSRESIPLAAEQPQSTPAVNASEKKELIVNPKKQIYLPSFTEKNYSSRLISLSGTTKNNIIRFIGLLGIIVAVFWLYTTIQRKNE